MPSITTITALLGFGLVYAQAAPQAPGFSALCPSLKLNDGWLIGNCSSGDKAATVQSTVFLGGLITNSEGILKWAIDGAYQESCSSCNLGSKGAVLNCTCNHSWRGTETTTVNLEEHISVSNGYLVSDLAGTPKVPVASPVPVPNTFGYQIGVSKNARCSDPSTYYNIGPTRCFVFWFWSYEPNEMTNGLFMSDNPGYEVVFYNNTGCTGEPVDRILPSDGKGCKKFNKAAIAMAVRPLWNSA